MWLGIVVAGCGVGPERGHAPVLPPELMYLDAPDQVLASGLVGAPYTASLQVSGGAPPYTWEAPDGVPPGLGLLPSGRLSGTPRQAGATTFAAIAHDSEGRSKRMLATLSVALEPRRVACGDHVEGRFQGSAWGEAGLDLASRDVVWLAVDLTDARRGGDAPTRVSLAFDVTGDAVAWVERPQSLVGSWNLEQDYVYRKVAALESPVAVDVDAGTDPSLTGFQTEALLPVLLAPKAEGRWALDVVCTDGPVFQTLGMYPKRLGDAFEVDYEVYGDNTGVEIWTDDPLPDWLSWDRSTGVVTGTAAETGAWEFTIHARDAAGHQRDEAAILSVYETTDVACDTDVPVPVDESFVEGAFVKRFDPRGFRVFRLPLPVPADGGEVVPSRVSVRLTGSDSHYLGLAKPSPGWQRFFGSAEEVEAEGASARLHVGPDTYPSTHHFAAAGELYFTAASLGTVLDGMVAHVSCDLAPAPDLGALPVLQPLQPVSLPLAGIGGHPPYTWSAEGLPAGLTVTRAGVLQGSAAEVGRSLVRLVVTDARGETGEATLPLTVGDAPGCLGLPELACGDVVEGVFTEAWAPGVGRASTRSFCVADTARDFGLALTSDGGSLWATFADPGVDGRRALHDPQDATIVAEAASGQVVGAPFDAWSWPDRGDYAGRPLFVTVWAEDPGAWTAHLDCPLTP